MKSWGQYHLGDSLSHSSVVAQVHGRVSVSWDEQKQPTNQRPDGVNQIPITVLTEESVQCLSVVM